MSSSADPRRSELDTDERLTASESPDRELSTAEYRDYLYPLDHPNIAPFRSLTPRAFAAERLMSPDTRAVLAFWADLYDEPFSGVTSDGVVREGLFSLVPQDLEHAAPTAAMVSFAREYLSLLPPHLRARATYEIDAPQWRAWSNPEVMIHEVGLRLEDLAVAQRAAALDLVRASLSGNAYELVRTLMATNGYLGALVELPSVMNEYSYQFAIYGEPSEVAPWGWQLYGHHISLNVVVVGSQMAISPVFLGAEPSIALTPGEPIPLSRRHNLALRLMQSLEPAEAGIAQLYTSVRSPDMPEGRLLPVEERHLAGAFRDNRRIPYEGICIGSLDENQQELVWALVEDNLLLPAGPARVRMRQVRAHADETFFCWIGGIDAESPTYFRVQSPVIVIEFDHHAGVWLSNQFPAVFHVHTTMRTPNGNDYGRSLVQQYARSVGS